MTNPDGTLAYLNEDITERRRVEKLRLDEKRLEGLLEISRTAEGIDELQDLPYARRST